MSEEIGRDAQLALGQDFVGSQWATKCLSLDGKLTAGDPRTRIKQRLPLTGLGIFEESSKMGTKTPPFVKQYEKRDKVIETVRADPVRFPFPQVVALTEGAVP